MRKKYLYQNVPVRQNSRYIDVVSSLFSDYYFGFSKSFDEVDFFVKQNAHKLSAFILTLIVSSAFSSLSFFLFGLVSAFLSAIFLAFLLLDWFAFKVVLQEVKEEGIF